MIDRLSSLFTGAVILGLVAVVLTSCASTSPEARPTPETRYLAARLDLNALLGAAVTYSQKPRCTEAITAGCSQQHVVDRLYDSLSAVDTSLDAVGASLVAARQFCEVEHPDAGDARAACLSGRQNSQVLAISTAIAGLGAVQALLLAQTDGG